MKYNLNQSYHNIYSGNKKYAAVKCVLNCVLFIGIGYMYCLAVTYVIGKLFYGMF